MMLLPLLRTVRQLGVGHHQPLTLCFFLFFKIVEVRRFILLS